MFIFLLLMSVFFQVMCIGSLLMFIFSPLILISSTLMMVCSLLMLISSTLMFIFCPMMFISSLLMPIFCLLMFVFCLSNYVWDFSKRIQKRLNYAYSTIYSNIVRFNILLYHYPFNFHNYPHQITNSIDIFNPSTNLPNDH